MKHLYLPKEILKDNRLTPATKLVAHHLFHLSGWEKDNILPSSRELEKSLGITHPSASTAINILKELGYIQIEENNTFKFYINGINFVKADLSNKELCNLVGDFVIVPTFALYCDIMTAAERDAYIKFFDFYFGIEENHFFIKKDKIIIKSVSTYYGDSERHFRKHIQHIKEKGLLDYTSINSAEDSKIIIGAKAFIAEKKWVIYNNSKNNKKEEEKVVEEEETVESSEVPEVEISDEEINEMISKLPASRIREFEYKLGSANNQKKYEWLCWVLSKK